jgi:hypothetical protein
MYGLFIGQETHFADQSCPAVRLFMMTHQSMHRCRVAMMFPGSLLRVACVVRQERAAGLLKNKGKVIVHPYM